MTAEPRAARVAELRRLRTPLATLLGGIEDLGQEWDTTVELARHLRTQRLRQGQPADTAAVIADLEAIMHASAGLLPDYVPKATTVEELVPAIENAQKKYDNLIGQHLAWATTALYQDAPCDS